MSKSSSSNRKGTLGRRRFLQTTATAAAAASLPLGLTTNVRAARMNTNGTALINVFLRGGSDGLVWCFPRAEMSIDWAVTRPNTAPLANQSQSLDGYFDRPDSISALDAAWTAGHLTYIHGVGLETKERSHFSAMDDWEFAGSSGGPPSGWIGRVLQMSSSTSPIIGMARQSALPKSFAESFTGGQVVLPVPNPSGFEWTAPTTMGTALQAMYANEPPPVGPAVGGTFQTFDHFENGAGDNLFDLYVERPGSNYGTDSFAQGLRDIACAIKNDLGIDAFEVDVGGWDFHNNLGPNLGGNMANKMEAIANALNSFYFDMHGGGVGTSYLDKFCLVMESEFGRRVKENQSAGTDHGWGGLMLLMGEGLVGQTVHIDNRWETNKHSLDNLIQTAVADGDLPAFTDFRHVLSEILHECLGLTTSEVGNVFESPFVVDQSKWMGLFT